jgi:hypothetical protein
MEYKEYLKMAVIENYNLGLITESMMDNEIKEIDNLFI